MDVLAYAKLNLSLRVGCRQHDGYHPVRSLIQTIDLADRITIEAIPGGDISVQNSLGIDPEADLGAAAARAVLRAAGSSAGMRIRIDKRIPTGAGLGGGSSDAAAVLVAANLLLGEPLSQQALHQLGASLGADVPLFLYGGALRVSGRGDTIDRRDASRGEVFVVIVPPVHCNTALVYDRFDTLRSRRQDTPPIGHLELAANDLESAAIDLYPQLAPVAAALRLLIETAGAAFAGMSGSGSAYYAAFLSRDAAERAQRSVETLFPEAQVLLTRPTPLGHSIEGEQP
ncbi:4-(cytidine 5'-diphospho)-2-C-methyl-D-erythritol kinase [Candidatus Bipolaricaulota bacterium]|nr:4-(cytidine 5'-diphospho)-2-C-methyl-D-erythritol kinase [Candidatus Bipolaricaulota bacterium]